MKRQLCRTLEHHTALQKSIKMRKSSHASCCVSDCKNTSRNSDVKYYKFPTRNYKLLQRDKWIAAVRKINGQSWIPKPSDTICSGHFIGGAKAEEELSPSYAPSIFSSGTTPIPSLRNQKNIINRHKRYVQRILDKRIIKPSRKKVSRQVVLPKVEVCIKEEPFSYEDEMEAVGTEVKYCDRECEAVLFVESSKSSATFVCNRFMYMDSFKIMCEAETQTDIFRKDNPDAISSRKLFKDVGCNTTTNAFEDKSVGPKIKTEDVETTDQFILGMNL